MAAGCLSVGQGWGPVGVKSIRTMLPEPTTHAKPGGHVHSTCSSNNKHAHGSDRVGSALSSYSYNHDRKQMVHATKVCAPHK